jgi:hypothetical protein
MALRTGSGQTSFCGTNAGSNGGVLLAGDDGVVKPGGVVIAPGPASLDPLGLNGPLSPDAPGLCLNHS